MKVAFLATDMVEQVELTEPWDTVLGQGWEAELVSLKPGTIQAANHHEKADRFAVDRTLDGADAGEYDALVVPGGVANPDEMRTHPDAVSFVRDFVEQGKPVAVICHGPWMLVEADVLRGRRLTSWPSLRTDIRNAGGEWKDEPVVVDNGLITSRKPDDLGAFCDKLVEELCEGQPTSQTTTASTREPS